MESKELMEGLFGTGAPYPGMDVEWEVFAGEGAMESGIQRGKITSITFCEHCGLPSIKAKSEHGAIFTIRISQDGKFVCGSEAPK